MKIPNHCGLKFQISTYLLERVVTQNTIAWANLTDLILVYYTSRELRTCQEHFKTSKPKQIKIIAKFFHEF